MENSFQSRNIKSKDLVLWDENARFPDKYSDSTEEELIEYFLSKKDFKISEFEAERRNPLDFDTRNNHKFYSYKVKRLLSDITLGIVPTTV